MGRRYLIVTHCSKKRTLRDALGTLDARTQWDALGQRPFFRTVSHVEVTVSHRDGVGMETGRRREGDANGMVTD